MEFMQTGLLSVAEHTSENRAIAAMLKNRQKVWTTREIMEATGIRYMRIHETIVRLRDGGCARAGHEGSALLYRLNLKNSNAKEMVKVERNLKWSQEVVHA